MVRSVRLQVAVALAFAAAGDWAEAQVDLTPTETFYEVEGIRMPNVTFHDGAKRVTYSPPAGWALSGGGSSLVLTPRDKAQAGAVIETEAARAPLLPASAANLKAYSEAAMAVAPREAGKLEMVEALICPMRISGKLLVEITLSYTFFGQPYRMNVLFMPRDRELLRFRISARAADYPAVLREFRGSLFSIQGL